MTVDEVPRQLRTALNHLVLEVLILSLLVDDVASVELLHLFLVSGSLSQGAIVSSCKGPQVLDTLRSWLFWLLILHLSLNVSLLARARSEANTTADDLWGLVVLVLSSLFVFDDLRLHRLRIQILIFSLIPAFFGVLIILFIRRYIWLPSTLASLRHL